MPIVFEGELSGFVPARSYGYVADQYKPAYTIFLHWVVKFSPALLELKVVASESTSIYSWFNPLLLAVPLYGVLACVVFVADETLIILLPINVMSPFILKFPDLLVNGTSDCAEILERKKKKKAVYSM